MLQSSLTAIKDDDEEEDNFMDIVELQKKMSKPINARASVSAEVYGTFNQKKSFVAKVVQKSDEVKERIQKKLEQSFMFANLDDKEKCIVIDAMEEKKYTNGDIVIKQGDDGDVLYVVDTGSQKCQRRMKADDQEDTFLKNYQPGEAFGELALLYNAPRAATIIANEDSVLLFLFTSNFRSFF